MPTDWGSVGSGAASGAATGTAVMPGIGTAVGAVIGAFAGYLGGRSAQKAAAKLTPEQKALFDILQKNIRSSSEFGTFLQNLSKDPIIGGTNFMQTLAHGDRESLGQVLGPELGSISTGAQRSLQTMGQLAPRSGASAEFLSSLPTRVSAAQQGLVNNARVGANQNLTSLGMSLGSMGSSALGTANAGAESALGFTQRKQEYAGQIGADTAGSIYSIFQNILGYNSPSGSRIPGILDAFANRRGGAGVGPSPGPSGGGGGFIPGSISGSRYGSGGSNPWGPTYGYRPLSAMYGGFSWGGT